VVVVQLAVHAPSVQKVTDAEKPSVAHAVDADPATGNPPRLNVNGLHDDEPPPLLLLPSPSVVRDATAGQLGAAYSVRDCVHVGGTAGMQAGENAVALPPMLAKPQPPDGTLLPAVVHWLQPASVHTCSDVNALPSPAQRPRTHADAPLTDTAVHTAAPAVMPTTGCPVHWNPLPPYHVSVGA
jgi:hypothetical protein